MYFFMYDQKTALCLMQLFYSSDMDEPHCRTGIGRAGSGCRKTVWDEERSCEAVVAAAVREEHSAGSEGAGLWQCWENTVAREEEGQDWLQENCMSWWGTGSGEDVKKAAWRGGRGGWGLQYRWQQVFPNMAADICEFSVSKNLCRLFPQKLMDNCIL